MNLAELLHLSRTGYVGVYITDGFMSAVQLRGRPKADKVKVLAWSMAALPPDAIKEGEVVDKDLLAVHLEKLFQNPSYGTFTGKQAILTMPEHVSFHRVFSHPAALAGQTLYSTAYQNTMPHIPFQNDEVYWDWKVIKRDEKVIHFYSVAVPRNVLTPFRTALTKVGYSVEAVETGVISSMRFFFGTSTLSQGLIVISVGQDEIAVSTIDDMGVHQSSIIPDEGIQIWARDLAKELKVEPAQAMKDLSNNGLMVKKGDSASRAIAVFAQQRAKMILNEVQEHRLFFSERAHEVSKEISHILVTGAGGLMPGLSLYLGKSLKLSAIDPKPAVTYAPAWEKKQLYLLPQACGAAILGLQREKAGEKNISIIKSQATGH